MLHSICRHYRRVGLFALVHAVLYRFAQRLMTLDVTRVLLLDQQAIKIPKQIDSETRFDFLTAEEVCRFSEDPHSELHASHADRLAGGRDFCFAAISENRLAAYAWFALDSVSAEGNRGRQENTGVAVAFPQNTAFMYHGFTHPDFRGQGLYGQINGLAMRKLSDQGIQFLLSTMDWTNRAAYRSCQRLGFIELGFLWRWGWGRWMHTWAPQKAKRLGFRFGPDAELLSMHAEPVESASMGELAQIR